MKRLIWKLRYTKHLHSRSGMPMRFCWGSAESQIENLGTWVGECPIAAADEEYYCMAADSLDEI